MMRDSNIERSLEAYIRRRIKEIPSELKQMFPDAQDSQLDLLCGYYAGRIEEGALRFILKATRASGSLDLLEIHARVMVHRREIRDTVSAMLNL